MLLEDLSQRIQNETLNHVKSNMRKTITLVMIGIIGLFFLIAFISAAEIVDAGERAVVLRVGKVVDVKSEGFYWRKPFLEKYQKLDVKTQKIEVEADAASRDLQSVSAKIALNYNLEPESVGLLWQEIGADYRVRVIDPSIQEAVKAITAQYNAEELITKRSEVRDGIKTLLKEKLAVEHIVVTEFAVTDFSFSKSFDNAIEAKVTAEQRALEAKNKLEQVKFEAEQQITQAKAEAESIRIQAQAITQQGGKDYVQLQAISKWDGKLPTQFVPGSAVPFLTL